MPDFALTGKKGTGKSKNAVRLARDIYLAHGRRVATNLDLFLKPMFGVHSKVTYVRLPDKPSAFDLEAAGQGQSGKYDEDTFGGLFLDEMGTWINSRSFGDKDRQPLLDFLAHGRKMRWDAYYIMQDVMQVDKQLRESFIEYTVRHIRFDRVRVPFVGGLLGALFGPKARYLPRFHRAQSRLGCNPQALVADSVLYTGKDVEPCYDTTQIFRPDYAHGTYSVLSPWHVEGRFLKSPRTGWLGWLRAFFSVRDRPRSKALPSYRNPLLARIAKLPPDRRVYWTRRALAAGLVDRGEAAPVVTPVGARSVPSGGAPGAAQIF
jgi:hypothetical protein